MDTTSLPCHELIEGTPSHPLHMCTYLLDATAWGEGRHGRRRSSTSLNMTSERQRSLVSLSLASERAAQETEVVW